MPVFIGPRKPTEFQAEDQAHVIQADLSHQPLEPGSMLCRFATLALIIVDDNDAICRPPQSLGELRQGVLPFTRLAVLQDLLRRRLSYIHQCHAIEVYLANFRR
jgi:hypothetical protein